MRSIIIYRHVCGGYAISAYIVISLGCKGLLNAEPILCLAQILTSVIGKLVWKFNRKQVLRSELNCNPLIDKPKSTEQS